MTIARSHRSASLLEDLAHPERFEAYRPTRRSIPIMQAILQPGSSTMVIAPYGSGKSLTAGVASVAVRNGPVDRRTLRGMLERIGGIDAELAARLDERSRSNLSGLVVVLSGYVENPLAEVAAALKLDHVPTGLDGLAKALRQTGCDHVAIVWDEFGRQLEGLVGSGRSKDLDFLQRLAERVSRASSPTMSLTLLLHQNLLAYAAGLNETSRSEWRKVEGRFAPLRILESSREIYELAADLTARRRSPGIARASIPESVVDECLAAGWFDRLDDKLRVSRILEAASPVTPGALQILPFLVARVGQNERTMFSFLGEVDLSAVVGIEEVYEAFADSMRADVGVGGSYRRYIETQSARSRAEDGLQREILAAACLFQLGTSGERQRLSRQVLELAVWGRDRDKGSISDAIDVLLAKKLLIWRRHTDDVAIWHGADIDVSQRVQEERDRVAAGFDLKAFLSDRFPPPKLRATGHNARYGVNRFLEGYYQAPDEILAGVVPDHARSSGAIVYVLARHQGELDAVERHLVSPSRSPAGIIYVLPNRPLEIENVGMEILALEALTSDVSFTASDPMVTVELDEMRSVAFSQLALQLQNLISPRSIAATWLSGGSCIDISADLPGTVVASQRLNSWFGMTPRIANDQLMRDQVSRTMQTARIRVVGSILERDHRERLGYAAGDRSAEGSIFRTVLEQTGLYLPGEMRLAYADEIADAGLAHVCRTIRDFFVKPSEDGSAKRLSELVDELSGRPTGVPRGVMPLLIAAVYKRHAKAVAFYRGGVLVPDLLGFQFDQMVQDPNEFSLRVLDCQDLRLTNYLRELTYAFVHEHPLLEDELVGKAYSAVRRWSASVPEGARRSRKLDDKTARVLKAVSSVADPVDLFLVELPAIFGRAGPHETVIAGVEAARKEIDALSDVFAEEAVATVVDVLHLEGGAGKDAVEMVRDWAGCFELSSMLERDDLRISDKAVLRKASETANGRFSPKSLAGALSSIVLQRSLDKWDDKSEGQFRNALREARVRLEAAALDTDRPGPELRPIVESRIAQLRGLLGRIGEAHVPKLEERRRGGGK